MGGKAKPDAKKEDGTPYTAMDLREIRRLDCSVHNCSDERCKRKSVIVVVTANLYRSPDLKRLAMHFVTAFQTALQETMKTGPGFMRKMDSLSGTCMGISITVEVQNDYIPVKMDHVFADVAQWRSDTVAYRCCHI